MASVVYILSSITCFICTVLLIRSYMSSRVRLLYWSALCFSALTVANVLLFIDLVVFPNSVDLRVWRLGVTLGGLMALLYGMILKSE